MTDRRPDDPADRARCDHCEDVIGIYEPLVILFADGDTVRTSLAATPDAPDHGRLLHARCHPTRREDRRE